MSVVLKCLQALLASLPILVAPAAMAENEIPIPGMAPGSQNGDGAPFTGLAQTPAAHLFTGSATTSIALNVPHGRLDMTPSLSLRYSSQGGRGPYGHGWSIAGGRVSRSTKHGTPLYDDALDVFVLELPGTAIELIPDGGKLYRAVHDGTYFKIGFDTSANYWKVIDPDGTVFLFGSDPTRHSRSGPDTSTSEGTFAWYLEHTEDIYTNNIEYHYVDPYESPWPARPSGLLDHIEYGGNMNSAVAHMFRMNFIWQYSASAHPRRWIFAQGFPEIADDAWTLDRVDVRFVETSGAETTVRSYDLSYDRDTTTEVARLADVELTASTSDSTVVLPATIFEYSAAMDLTGWPTGTVTERAGTPDLPYRVTITPPTPSGHGFRDTNGKIQRDLVDLNGDALLDSIFLDAGTLEVRMGTGGDFAPPVTWTFPAGFSELRNHIGRLRSNLLDLNGDALPDFVHAEGTDCIAAVGDPCWDVYQNLGSGFDTVATPWSAPKNHIQRLDKLEPPPYLQSTGVRSNTIDLNNDGLPDFVDATDSDHDWDGVWQVYWNTGSGFASMPDEWTAPSKPGLTIEYLGLTRVTDTSGGDPSSSLSGLVDMNGDGLPDMLRSDTGDEYNRGADVDHWEVWLNNGYGFEPVTEWKVPASAALLPNTFGESKSFITSFISSRELVDVTGDGLPDLVDTAYYYFNQPVNACPAGPGAAETCPFFGGPHPPECCELIAVFANTGSGFAAPLGLPHWSANRRVRQNTDPSANIIGPVTDVELLDFDGDGLLDLLESDGTSWFFYPNWMTPRAHWSGVNSSLRYKPNLLVSMMNGMGAISVLEYAPASLISDLPCQRDAGGSPLAGACIPFPHRVVTTVETSDSLSSVPTTYANYAYSDGKYDGAAREFRGFGRAASVDAEGRTIVTEYHQDAARTGRIHRSWTLGNPDCGGDSAVTPFDPNDPCNPWLHKLGFEENTWGNPLDPINPKPALLMQTRAVPYYDGAPRTELEKTTVFAYDAFGNEDLRTTIIADPLTPSRVLTTRVDPSYDSRIDSVDGSGMPRRYIVNRPTRIVTNGDAGPLHEKRFTYKSLLYAKRVETCARWSSDQVCTKWTRRSEGRNALGLITKSKTESKRRAKYYYGDAYRLYPTKLRDGRLQTLSTYDQVLGRPVAMVAPDGEEAGLRYDALGRTTERWGPDPSYAGKGANWLLESIAYVEPSPALGLPGRIRRDAVGTTPSVTFYDAVGRKIATKASVETTTGTSVVLVSDLAAYDSFGRPIALAAPIVAIDQSNIEMLATDFAATPISEHTTTVYDVKTGKRTQVRPPDTATVEFEYRSPGLEITRDPSGLMRISYLDALGRTYATERCVDPLDLGAITPSYRCPVNYRRQRLEYAFDGMDRPTTSWVQNLEIEGEPMEWLRAIDYDGLGNQIRIRDRNSGEWLKSFDKRGQHVGTLAPDGAETSFKYKKGRLIETRVEHPYPADKLITKRTYVRRGELGAGKLESITTKDGIGTTARTLSYTPRGLVAREAVAISTFIDGEVFTSRYSTTTTYDEADRVLSIAYPTANASGQIASEQVSVGHNAHGQVTTLTSGNGQIFVSDVDYDLYGNTVSVDYGNQLSDHYAYARHEDGGRLECMRTTASSLFADGCAQSSVFDYRSLTYERDISGRIIKINDRHNDASEAHSFNYHAAYHDDGRLAAATYRSALSVPVDKDEYEYDTLGRLTERIRTDAQVAVTLAYQYSSAWPDDNPDGPIVPLHRLQSYGATAVQYNAAGRQITKGDTEYVYDQVGRLHEVHTNDALVALHQYDEGESRVAKYVPATDTLIHYFGNLFEIHIDVGTQSAELVRHFSLGGGRVASDRSLAPDGLVVVASTAAGAARSSPRSIHAPKSRPLAHPHQDASAVMARSALSHLAWAISTATGGAILFGIALFPDRRCVAFSTTALLVFSVIPIPHTPQWLLGNAQAQSLTDSLVYYHTDHLGSVQLVTDDNPSGAQLVESIRYRAYGEVRGIFGDPPAYVEEDPPVLETTAGYGGHEADSESGLLYFGARHYDPELAMFLTPDAAAQFPSPFSYSAWDPVNNFDPDGNFAFLAILIAVLQFVSQVMAIGFAIAAIVMNPSAGPMAVIQQYVLSVAGGGWKGVGTLLLSALARTPGSFQSAVQTAHVANSGLGAAMAIRDGDTLGAIASISSAATGNGGTGEVARAPDNSGSPAGSLAKYLNSDATASATPSAGPSVTTGIDGPMIDAAYHVSRPLIGSGNAVLSHNYISTHADFIGDPNATLSSFGESLDGTLDRMTGNNAGSFSEPTVNADRQHWLSLEGSGAGRDVVPIPASSTKVERLLASFPGGYDYAAIAGPFGFNSNSASQWVANMAAGSPQPIPGEPGRLAPGARNWFRIPRGR